MNISMMALVATAVRNTYYQCREQARRAEEEDDERRRDDERRQDDERRLDDATGASGADKHLPVCRITLDVEGYKEALSRISAGK